MSTARPGLSVSAIILEDPSLPSRSQNSRRQFDGHQMIALRTHILPRIPT